MVREVYKTCRGPSYLWAILSDTRVSGEEETSNTPPADTTLRLPTPEYSGPHRLPGTHVSVDELNALGFLPLELDFKEPVELAFGQFGIDWNTLGEVPNGPGIYAFTVEVDGELRVTYVGMTTHLWMVTRGRMPAGGGRGGQRYGRPKHAGVTRERINVLVAEQVRMGRVVTHWVKPVDDVAERQTPRGTVDRKVESPARRMEPGIEVPRGLGRTYGVSQAVHQLKKAFRAGLGDLGVVERGALPWP